MTDRILSVKQPWATLLVHGLKNVENRTWSTPYRGRVWIHASVRPDSNAWLPFDVFNKVGPTADLPRGAVIGHVELVDVIDDSGSRWADAGAYHWIVRNAVRIRPIPYVGGLGLRHFNHHDLYNRKAVTL